MLLDAETALLLRRHRAIASLLTDLGSDMLRSATVTLTNAQIKALPSGDVALVAAPTAGSGIIPLGAYIAAKVRTAYTNVDAAGALWIAWGDGGSPAFSPVPNDAGAGASALTELLTNTAVSGLSARAAVSVSSDETTGWGGATAKVLSDANEGAGLFLHLDNGSSGNLTGGDAANAMAVTVLYAIVSL